MFIISATCNPTNYVPNLADHLKLQITAMKASNASLKAQIAQDHDMSCKMKTEISEARAQFSQAEQDGARLRNEIGMLRSHFMVEPRPDLSTLRCSMPCILRVIRA